MILNLPPPGTDKLPIEYFRQEDVVHLAKDLIGKKIFTCIDDQLTAGIITETEAYRGWGDKACHANEGKRTARTEIMFHPGGVAYMYLCYGIHYLFNIVTHKEGEAAAVLVRAIEPTIGTEIMLQRRNKVKVNPALTAGPGNVSQALGLNRNHYGNSLVSDTIWLEPNPDLTFEITTSTRIGVDYAGEDALLPWRFYMKNNHFVTKK